MDDKSKQGQGAQQDQKDDRNREETGKPMQLDEKDKKPGMGQGGQHGQQGGQHQGGQGQTGHGQGGSQQGGQKR